MTKKIVMVESEQEAKLLFLLNAKCLEVERLRQSIRALIEVYAPHERKAVLLREHLTE